MGKRIRLNIPRLLREKGDREGRRLPYHVAAKEIGISYVAFQRYASDGIDRMDKGILVSMCNYFNCGIEDLMTLEDLSGTPG